jgi:predicted nucleotidyltransferase
VARSKPAGPPPADDDAVRQRFTAALDALVAQAKTDRSVLAALLCGSLSYDRVWTKSDIDLVFVTIDDRKVEQGDISLYADGVNVHAILVPRTQFRRMVEGSVRNSFAHSFLTRGRLLYTHDPTIERLCASLTDIGRRDQQVQLLRAATHALPAIDKAHKWLTTRGDLDYTALWILYAATPLAQVEVIDAGLLVDREVIPQAMRINAPFFKTIYSDLLNAPKTRRGVEAALSAVDDYIARVTPKAFGPILDYLQEVGEARSCREIEDHFKRNFDVEGVTTACEYLADRGLIGKASTATRLTKTSSVDVQELAFFSLGPA